LEIVLVAGINGLVWGLIYALIAIGLSFIFGLLFIVNAAHGHLYMFAAFIVLMFLSYTSINPWLALIIAVVGVTMFGMLLERVVIKPIERQATATLVATFGVAIILEEVVRATTRGLTYTIPAPIKGGVALLGVYVSYPVYNFAVAGIAAIALMGLWIFLANTRLGLFTRASQQDGELAMMMGIPVDKVYMISMGLGTLLVALAGTLVMPLIAFNHAVGLDALMIAFIITIVGGMASLKGTFFAAFLIAEVENLALVTPYFVPTTARLLTLAVLCVVLLVRPHGLFGVSR